MPGDTLREFDPDDDIEPIQLQVVEGQETIY